MKALSQSICRIKMPSLLLGAAMLTVSLLSAQPQGTTTVTFDGACDGMTVVVTGLLIGGTHNNYGCGGFDTYISGNTSTDFLLQPKLGPDSRANIATYAGVELCLCVMNYYLDFNNNTWAAYEIRPFVGSGPEALLSQGTFTVQPPDAKRGGGATPSWHPTGAAPPEESTPAIPGIPEGTFDISFDGHCDGMHLEARGAKIGGTGTGCNTPELGGNSAQEPSGIVPGTNVSDVGANIQSTLDWYDCLTVYNLYWNQQTWAAYQSCGDAPVLIDSGTFSYSPPPPNAAGLKSSLGR